MSLATPKQIRELQRKLYLKAKREPTYRFYSLYDKVSRRDVLGHAYRLMKSNGGAAGVDGQTFQDIEAYGEERFLGELERELRERRYRPHPVKRVTIPKPGGGERPLGIPTVRDRTVQAAAKLVLEPIFEADFTENAHGYRPRRSAERAVREMHQALRAGYTDVVDADVSKYFDTIPHDDLLRSVARRVSDGRTLHLVKMWLKTPIEASDDPGRRGGKSPGNRGTPQGGVLSPLLANIYMRRFLVAWALNGYERALSARIVNYADDFVIVCRRTADQALTVARSILTRLGLTLNETKTRTCNAWRESFDFLGYTFGVHHAFGSGRRYLGASPSAKSLRRLKDAVRALTGPQTTWQTAETTVGRVNRLVRGWMGYFCYGSLWKPYGKVDRFLHARLREWLVRKHKPGTRGERRYPAGYVYGSLGLVMLVRGLADARTPC